MDAATVTKLRSEIADLDVLLAWIDSLTGQEDAEDAARWLRERRNALVDRLLDVELGPYSEMEMLERIDAWHDLPADDPVPLSSWLGMTFEQYARWASPAATAARSLQNPLLQEVEHGVAGDDPQAA